MEFNPYESPRAEASIASLSAEQATKRIRRPAFALACCASLGAVAFTLCLAWGLYNLLSWPASADRSQRVFAVAIISVFAFTFYGILIYASVQTIRGRVRHWAWTA